MTRAYNTLMQLSPEDFRRLNEDLRAIYGGNGPKPRSNLCYPVISNDGKTV